MKNDWIYEREKKKKPLQGFQLVEKSKGTVADGDVFEAEAIGWYLKTRSKGTDASECAKGNRN